MRLQELVELVSIKRKEVNKEKVESELKNTLNQLKELRESLEKIREIKDKMLLCGDYIKDERGKVLTSNDPDYISKMSSLIYDKITDCYRKIEEEKRKRIEELSSRIREINEKLLLYKKIFRNIFNENVDVRMLNERAEDLEEEIKKGEKTLENLYMNLKEKAGKNLDLLVKLVEEGEIEISEKNSSDVIELIKFLTEKGIPLSLRFSK